MIIDDILSGIEKKGFSFVENFLTPEELKTINHFFDSHNDEFCPALIGPSSARQRNESVRGDYTFWIDPLDPPPEFKKLMSFLDQLKDQLNAGFYLGLKQYECHLAYYPPGTFYKKHSDRFETSSSRSLSFVFYLNEEWSSSDSGELVLYSKDGETLKTVHPSPGSFICFLSEDFPHEVKPSSRERRSLTGWMHTKIIY